MNAPVNLPKLPAPIGLLAELTHRCPLGCPYCSNPAEMDKLSDEMPTEVWKRVFTEATAVVGRAPLS